MRRKKLMFVLTVAGLLSVGCPEELLTAQATQKLGLGSAAEQIVVEKPGEKLQTENGKNRVAEEIFSSPDLPFSAGIFPCSNCHAGMEPNLQPRVLEDMHADIVLRHGEDQRWCLDCHNPENRDKLHLISTEIISFAESYRLCGQCHGDKMRDWRHGIHGKRTGYWNADKQYLLCVHCHDPHNPGFKGLKPLPPPARPKEARH